MIRLIVFILFFMFLVFIQHSFFASLPGALPLFPVVLTVGVYLLQHQSLPAGAWLIVANGLFIDFFHLQMAPVESISYAVTALVATYLARHVFSNRSLYGVLACGLATFAVLKLVQMGILALSWIRNAEAVYWRVFYLETFWSSCLLVLGLILLFPFATSINKLLQKSFLSHQDKTF